ncbi:chaperone protein dnaJ 11, chloroplastic-like [Carex rostrata]
MISSPAFSNPNSINGFRSQIRSKTRHTVTCIATTSRLPHTLSSTLYDVLGIKYGATSHEIKAAYRRLVRECHPDIVGDDQKAESVNEFIRVHAAYATLLDPEKRADYDRGMMVATSGRCQGAPHRRSVYSRSPRTWETDQCW